MQVQRVKNNNYNTNFGMKLVLRKDMFPHKNWDVINEKELKRLVTTVESKTSDIEGTMYVPGVWNYENDSILVNVYFNNGNYNDGVTLFDVHKQNLRNNTDKMIDTLVNLADVFKLRETAVKTTQQAREQIAKLQNEVNKTFGELDKKVDTKLKSVKWRSANEVLNKRNGLEPDSNDFKSLNRFFEQDEEIQNNFLGADDLADNVRKPKGESPNVEPPKVEQPKTESPKADVETPKVESPNMETPKAPALKPAEEIDGSDFSKLEGEFDEYGKKVIKDADGNVVREFCPSKDGKTLSWVSDCDPNTGKHIKETYFCKDGKTLECITDYDPSTFNRIKRTYFRKDGKTFYWVADYDPKTGNKIKQTDFRGDGKTLGYINDHDPNTGNSIKSTYFRKDGKTIDWIDDYDPSTYNRIKQTCFREDGKKVRCVIEFDPQITYKEIQTIYYKEDGTVDKIVTAE